MHVQGHHSADAAAKCKIEKHIISKASETSCFLKRPKVEISSGKCQNSRLSNSKGHFGLFSCLSYRCRLNDCGCAMKNAEEDLALNDLFGLEIGLESQTI